MIPSVGNRSADKAVCEDGTREEAEIGYEDQVANSSEYTGGEEADVEENNRRADKCDGGDPDDYGHELALAPCLSAQSLLGKEHDLPSVKR